jgi:transposase InsO family protein
MIHQFGVDPGSPIHFPVCQISLPDLCQQIPVTLGPVALQSIQPIVVPALGHLQNATQGRHVALIMDLYSRRIVGWSMGEKHTTKLIEEALKMAVCQRKDIRGVLLHSDQGVQYASGLY